MNNFCNHSIDNKHTLATFKVQIQPPGMKYYDAFLTYCTSCGLILKEEPVETQPEEVQTHEETTVAETVEETVVEDVSTEAQDSEEVEEESNNEAE